MTELSVSHRSVNPTVFLVTHKKDPRLYNQSLIKSGHYDFLVKMLESGPIYGTYLRNDDSFWEEEVFVCPQCIHASPIDYCSNEERTEIYCKYCYTDWIVDNGRMLMKWIQFDDDGNEIGEALI